MELTLKEILKCKTVERRICGVSGCISQGTTFIIDNTDKIFVKENSKDGAMVMYEGEFASLQTISETNTIKVPKPIKAFQHQGTFYLAMEYLNLQSGNDQGKQLGIDLANLHLHNACLKNQHEKAGFVGRVNENPQFVEKFGFATTTCCGFLPMENKWDTDWPKFFATNRIKHQLDIIERKYGDRTAISLWPTVQKNIPKLFPDDLSIFPSLLHGDLWSGNSGTSNGQPCIYDPASYYGHHEAELSISHMFGGFGPEFYNSYHEIIPKAKGFDKRQNLYKLFHYLNHWSHFGSAYKSSSIDLMKVIAAVN